MTKKAALRRTEMKNMARMTAGALPPNLQAAGTAEVRFRKCGVKCHLALLTD